MPSPPTLRPFAAAIDAQDWDTLQTLLAPDFHGLFVHDGRTFDAGSFVRSSATIPGGGASRSSSTSSRATAWWPARG